LYGARPRERTAPINAAATATARPARRHRTLRGMTAELIDLRRHAIPDPVAVRNVGAAQPHCIAHTGLPLQAFVRSGLRQSGDDGGAEKDEG